MTLYEWCRSILIERSDSALGMFTIDFEESADVQELESC